MKFVINKDQIISVEDKINLNSGSINYYEAEIECDETWNDLTVEAIIVGKETNNDALSVAVINNKISLDKTMSGFYSIGFIGYKIENEEKTYQISTNLARIDFDIGAGEIKTTNSEEVPTPTEWEIYIAQIEAMIENVPVIPLGGTTGQVLTKLSDEDGDIDWQTIENTKDYDELENKPSINNVELTGNKSLNDLGIENYDDTEIKQSILNKVDKEQGKGLSTNDYTTEEKNKLANLDNYDDTEIKADVLDLQTTKANITDIPDVSNFITKTVNDLANYYLKSETYTQTEINNLIGAIQQFHYEIVQTLPATGTNNVLYLVPKTTTETQNVYNEYVYANNNWEKIGDTQIDLTGYATENWVNTVLSNYTTTVNLTALLNEKQNNITSTNKLNSDLIDDTNNTNKFVTSTEKTTWNNKQEQLISGTNIKTINNESILGNGDIEIQVDNNPQVFYWDGSVTQTGLDFWNNVREINKTKEVLVFWFYSGYGRVLAIIEKGQLANENGSFSVSGFSYQAGSDVKLTYTSSVSAILSISQVIVLTCVNDNIERITINYSNISKTNYLDTNTNYSTPYTPLYNGSPATKKYVDDMVGNIESLLAEV